MCKKILKENIKTNSKQRTAQIKIKMIAAMVNLRSKLSFTLRTASDNYLHNL